MPPNMKPLMRVARVQSAIPRHQPSKRAFASRGGPLPGGTPGESSTQALPIGPYYESILTKPQPIPAAKPEQPPSSSSPPAKAPRSSTRKSKAAGESSSSSSSSGTATSTASATASAPATGSSTVPPRPSAQDKARIIFGSSLAGPAERADRLQSIRDRSTLVAGVLVPPRPEEPDNCCMSGCVNCVWDRYGEELEAWAAASTRAEEALRAERARGSADAIRGARATKDTPSPSPSNAAVSMDNDGGGSESDWRPEDMAKAGRPKIAKDLWDDDLYSNIPVGIREFMKHEKKLKKKHEEEGTFGG